VSKIDLINEDIDDLTFSLEEAQRHNSSMAKDIQDEIKNLKDEISSIQDSTSKAQVSIQEPLRGLNTITFTIDDDHDITFKTEAISYTPFYLEFEENKITLHPTQTTINLDS